MDDYEVKKMVSDEFITRLQAMNASGELDGYLCSQISKISLEPDWIIQGLTHNGLKGRIDTENNKKQFLNPMDAAVRLMIDEGIDPKIGLGILITGPLGLTERKFVVFLRGFPSNLEAISFQTSGNYNPQDIVRLILKYELNEELSTSFVEPHYDYVEQLQIDASEDKVEEALSLKIPKKKFHTPDWIRDASTQDDSQYILFSYGELNQVPPFSLLFASWCKALDVNKDTLVSLTIIGKQSGRVAIWDNQRKVAFFTIVEKESLEEIARKYYLSLWSSGEEKVGPPIKTREVVVGPKKSQPSLKDQADTVSSDQSDMIAQLHKKLVDIQEQLREFSLSELLIRIEAIESQLTLQKDASQSLRHSESQVIDSQSQLRLKEVIARLEGIANKLEELEARIQQIQKME